MFYTDSLGLEGLVMTSGQFAAVVVATKIKTKKIIFLTGNWD